MSDLTETQRNGMVKWFNSKAGYGFITVCGEDQDIFVHYSNIKASEMPYTYLTQGEYVQFNLTETDNGKHKFQAMNVTGIAGGPILCETRRNNRQTTNRDEGSEQSDEQFRERRRVSRVRRPPYAPRSSDAKKTFEDDTDGFTTVKSQRARKMSE